MRQTYVQPENHEANGRCIEIDGREFTVWDAQVSGFGVRVRPSGAKSCIVVYRAGAGRRAPVRLLHHRGGQ
jgi:hypothetical protein